MTEPASAKLANKADLSSIQLQLQENIAYVVLPLMQVRLCKIITAFSVA